VANSGTLLRPARITGGGEWVLLINIDKQENDMKGLLIACVSLLMLFSVSALAEPFAPHEPWNKSFVKKTGLTEKELDAKVNKHIPTKEDVDVPVYPGAYYHASYRGLEQELISVALASRDEPEKVRAWYKENYSGDKKIEIKPFIVYETQAQIADIGDLKTKISITLDVME